MTIDADSFNVVWRSMKEKFAIANAAIEYRKAWAALDAYWHEYGDDPVMWEKIGDALMVEVSATRKHLFELIEGGGD